MPITVLQTKLFCPHIRETLVSRPRLVERLHRGMNQPLVMISAPAGYGKTTLVSEWHAGLGRGYPLAWLTLDAEDNDPICFMTYFISALRTLKPDLGETVLSTLQSARPPTLEIILTSVVNELCEVNRPFCLVLDDYQVIEDNTIHNAVSFILDHSPRCMHLLLLSRVEPPLPLSRMRARNQICEIQTEELRFTSEEAQEFLNRVMKLELSQDNIDQLEQSTEGWIAGLQLAALSMQGRSDLQDFISSFTGSYHFIADYLVEEVLNRQTITAKSFLLKTSILERLNGGLCDAVTEASTGREMLEHLEHNNLFLIPLDNQRIWYRYHHLFAELLQNRLWREYPELVPQLYVRASACCATKGWLPEAILYALSGADYAHAASLIEEYIPEMQKRGELKTLSGWLDRMPDEMIRTKPRLCITRAWEMAYSSDPVDQVERYLQYATEAIDPRLPSVETNDLLAHIASIRANIAVTLGDNQKAVELCTQAESLFSVESVNMRSYNALMQADACWMIGDGPAALGALETALQTSRKAGDLQVTLLAMNYLARIYIAYGRLKPAKQVYQEALQEAADLGGPHWPATGVICVGLGMLYWELNDAATAMDYLKEGVTLAGQANDIDSLLFGYTTLARLYQSIGQVDQVQKMLAEADRLTCKTKLARDRYRLAARQVGLALLKGDLQAAVEWSKELSASVTSYSHGWPLIELNPLFIADQIMHARIRIAEGYPGEAIQLLSHLLPSLETAGRIRSMIEVLSLEALAFQAQGDTEQAIDALLRALEYAASEGFVRLFVDEGKPMQDLLRMVPVNGSTMKAYRAELLKAFEPSTLNLENPVPPLAFTLDGIIESLSGRELEVLRLIARGCSNQDIARELVIAIGTVKRHTANIFTKLDVDNRTEAVARARDLHLI